MLGMRLILGAGFRRAAESVDEYDGNVRGTAVLDSIHEQFARIALAFRIEHVHPVAYLAQIGRLGRDRENAVQPVDGDQAHEPRAWRAFAVQKLIEFGQQLLDVCVVRDKHRERHAAQPVDVELVHQLANGTALARGPRHHQDVASRIGL
jgi:hypothetical protein